jgi:hypothetical protein
MGGGGGGLEKAHRMYLSLLSYDIPQANTQKKLCKNDFHILQGTMFHRPLTNTSSLKITAAYSATSLSIGN